VNPLDALVWVDGVDSTCTPPLLRCLSRGEKGLSQVLCPFGDIRKRRALEPSDRLFSALPTRSVKFNIDLAELRVAGRLDSWLPESLARLRETSHRIFAANESSPRLLIPAILLIEAIWLWSERAARQLMVPSGIDLMVGRMTAAGSSRISPEMVSPEHSVTELRRVAWLSQDTTARLSWASVYTNAVQGRVALDLPNARLRGWAWGVELPRGVLVAEFDGLALDIDLPNPESRLQVGHAEIRVPPASEPAKGLPTFL